MKTAIGDVMREAYKRGWITSRDGNISVRRSQDGVMSDAVLITPSGVMKSQIHPDGITIVDINNPAQGKASVEMGMHLRILMDATSTTSVVHLHPTHTVAAMYKGLGLQKLASEFPELRRYTNVGPSVAFYPVGSSDLALNTWLNLNSPGGRFDIVGQHQHGVCAIGKSPWHAFEHIERLEHICQIALLANPL